MTPIKIVSLVLIIISLILSTTVYILTLYKNSKENNLSILNSYPYEYYMQIKERKRMTIYVLLLSNMLISSICIFFSLYNLKSAYSIMVAIMYIIGNILFSIGFITPLARVKTHVIFIIFSFLIYASTNIMLAFIKIIPDTIYYPASFSLAISIILGIFGFISLISLINPKLKDFAKLERSEDNGKTFYIKPKINFLAFYEWIYYILFEVSSILITVSFLISEVTF